MGNVKSVSGLPMQTELSWCSLGPVCLHTSPNHQKLNVGSQPRAQLRVQAQSLPPRDLSGLLVQSYNRKHLHSNPVGSFSFFHRFPADVILRAYKRELILKQWNILITFRDTWRSGCFSLKFWSKRGMFSIIPDFKFLYLFLSFKTFLIPKENLKSGELSLEYSA